MFAKEGLAVSQTKHLKYTFVNSVFFHE